MRETFVVGRHNAAGIEFRSLVSATPSKTFETAIAMRPQSDAQTQLRETRTRLIQRAVENERHA